MICELPHTLTLWAVQCFSSGLLSSFHALLQICPVGIQSFAHRRTKMSSPLGATGTESCKASASQSHRTDGSSSHAQIKMYPSPKSMALRGKSLVALLCSRLGIMALMALTLARLIPRCERLAKGLECSLISSPKFPIVRSRVH